MLCRNCNVICIVFLRCQWTKKATAAIDPAIHQAIGGRPTPGVEGAPLCTVPEEGIERLPPADPGRPTVVGKGTGATGVGLKPRPVVEGVPVPSVARSSRKAP